MVNSMTSDRSFDHQRLEIIFDPTQPQLLTGLDQWLKLGLIEDQQVRELCETHLSCLIPESVIVATPDIPQTEDKDFVRLTPSWIFSTLAAPVKQVSHLTGEIGQGFKEELSVRWFLFLGVFLVVTSSGLLAASQWEKLPNLGVYGVLWVYTLGFWGLGQWTSQQPHLSLTSKSLQAIAWLLVPINFWAMDSLLLGNRWGEWILLAIASVSLMGTFLKYRQYPQGWLIIINILVLSCLNWGWKVSSFPLIAIYGGTLITVMIVRFLRIPQTTTRYSLDLDKGLIVYALFILLLRGIFVAEIPLQALGLAIGISGWLLQRKHSTFRHPLTPILEGIGIVLLFLGWLVERREIFPWEATIISGLGLHFFYQRLQRDWWRRDLLAIFIIGLQSLFLIRELFPLEFRQEVMQWAMEVSNTQGVSYTFYSLILFPYIIIFAILTSWIYHKSHPKLAQFGDWLILGMTIILSILAFDNPLWRWVDLVFSTAIFAYISCHQNPLKSPFIYLANTSGILAICAFIYWQYPNLSLTSWAKILLGLMMISRIISILELPVINIYRHSSRYLGFVLGGISFAFLWQNVETFLSTETLQPVVFWWFLTPLSLTGVAIVYAKNIKKRRRAAFLSIYSLILFQSLTLCQPNIRLISLTVSAILMLINSYFFRHPFAARIQIGFTVGILILWILENFQGSWLEFLNFSDTLLDDGIGIMILWFVSQWLRGFHHPVAVIYAKATNGWAIFFCGLLLTRITLISGLILFNNEGIFSLYWQHLIAPCIVLGMLSYRYGKNPNIWSIYGTALSLELLIINSVLWGEGSRVTIAFINLITGLIILGFTPWLLSKFSRLSQTKILQLLPLFFGVMAVILRIGIFTYYTGLITLGVGLIGVGVNYYFHQQKRRTYIGLGLITFGIYEGVIYHLLQGVGGTLPNQLLILGLVTATLALFYRLFDWILALRGHHYFLNLSLVEIQRTAHTHWGFATLLKTIGVAWAAMTLLTTKANPYLNPINVSLSLVLSSYAFIQGRDTHLISGNNNQDFLKDIWVYLGFLDMASTLIFSRLIWKQLGNFDAYYAGFVGIIALFMYYIPWGNLGWKSTPWQRVSLILPSLLALVTTREIAYGSLLLVAVFYLQIGINQNNLRWSYISLGFLDWAIIRFLYENQLITPLNNSLLIGLSILYVAQFDPAFRNREKSKFRHYLRLLGSSLINITALLYYQHLGVIPLGISLLTISLGLGLKIRAFLYSGTSTFIINILYQLIIVSLDYSLAKWLFGLLLGIILIAIAAIFEQKREKIMTVWQSWSEVFKKWQ